jgi:hypothetical protein
MEDKKQERMTEWQDKFGIDPRSKGNIRRNGKNLPQGIDWEALINKGLQKGPSKTQTSLGFINNQQKDGKK